MGIGKYPFVNRNIRVWNHLSADILVTIPCKRNDFRKRATEVINVVN